MVDTILGYVVVTLGSAILVYATLGRLCKFHRTMKWEGGGQLSLAGEFAGGVFVLCIGLAAVQGSGVWVIPALAAFVIGYLSQRRTNRRHAIEEDQLRARNASDYPGIFDNPPPDDIDSMHTDELDVFDSGACTYLGRVAKHDVKVLIDRFGNMPEQGPNDIFLIPEFVGMLPEGSLSKEFVTLLQKGFEKREYLVLRWMPPAAGAKIFEAKG